MKNAMKLALEALEDTGWQTVKARKILEEALAKQEQRSVSEQLGEPVAWMYESVCGKDFVTRHNTPSYAKNIRPLYTTPQQRKPLTDEQIETLWHDDTSCDMPDELKQFKHTARAIEAAHNIF